MLQFLNISHLSSSALSRNFFCFRSVLGRHSFFKSRYIHSHITYATDNEVVVDSFDRLLLHCSGTQHCKQIHTHILITGLYRSAFLAARLLSVYSRFGLVMDAQKVFDIYPLEGIGNLLLWNAIVRANVSHGFYKEALELYDKMRKLGVWADGFTFPLIVRACALLGDLNLCKIVHCHVLRMGFQNHLHVVNELLGMYGKLGQMKVACKLFDRMAVRSYVSWNTMVSAYAFNYDCEGARKIFQRMGLERFEPNSVTWTSLLSSHARCGKHEEVMEFFGMMRSRGVGTTAEALAVVLSVCGYLVAPNKGKMIHGYVMKGGFEAYLFAKNALICMYGKCREVEDAHKLFLEMETKNLVGWNALISSYAESGQCDEAFELFTQLEKSDGYPVMTPNVISWSAVIGGFASNGGEEESLKLFRRMQLTGVMANSVTISSVLSVCAELAALNLGREIHGHVLRAMMDGNILVGNGLINMYTKCGSFKEGHLVFEAIDGKDLISWNSMITGYGMHGHVLSACSHAGLITEGRNLFDKMNRDYGIEPQMEHYACMVDLLGRAGLLQEASNIVKNMPMKPNACIWSALLNSCRMHKNTSIAEETAAQISHLNSEMTGSYMLLSNIYAASGRWEESARVRISAKTKGLKKIPGQSWIEVKKKVYMFSSGSPVQAGLELVYRILQELALQMESEDYIPDGDSSLEQNVNDGEMSMLVEAQ
ncbi:putative pentatricopeptide repeat-containing protein At1g17630 isoform X1 [Ziziphus jujuba]|uniref:Pentatricopeptide repeat-containing protein At1g17630 isoform X1 n=1 Tax=Ziziphus jujuba TaxID=326968 RepID=A0ABM3ZZN6_ZIZJJ|nr:putative pentatricopeptide repeat-containing protein At1g17630 isoform X1 [Ziziphus jujuba]